MEEKESRKGAMAASKSGGKITYFVVASCVMAAMGGVIFGYDIGVSGGVMSMGPFLERFFPKVYKLQEEDRIRRSHNNKNHYCLFNSQLLTSFTSSLYVSGFIATLLASSVTRSWGRKPSIFLGGVAFLAGSALGGSAQNVAMLIIARLLLGVGVGFANQSVPLYLSEMAPARYRGAISNGFQLCIGIGFLTANFTNYETQKIKEGYGWRISLATAAVPASILTLGSLFLPETPNSLIQTTGDVHKAELMLRRIRGTNNVQDELADLVEASSESNSNARHGFLNLLQTRYRPELAMAFAIPFFQQVTGINVVAFYAPVLFRTVGFGESGSLMSTLVSGIVGTASTFLSMLVVDRIGRKTLFLLGGLQMLASQVIIGVIIMVAEVRDGVIGERYGYAVVVLVCVYVAGFGWSWGPLGWLVPSEIFPLEIRSAAQSVTVAVSFVFTFAVAQSVPPMLCKFQPLRLPPCAERENNVFDEASGDIGAINLVMGREPEEEKHMDNKLNSSSQQMEPAEVKECTTDHNSVVDDGSGSHSSSGQRKKLSTTPPSHKTRGGGGGVNYTVPKPFSLSAEKPAASSVCARAGVDSHNSSPGNAASRNSSSGSRGSQPNSPMPARKTIDHKKHHDDEDTFSVASSSATSVRTIKPKVTIGVAPTFSSTSRLERRKEFYKKLEEKQKALEEEKRENEKRLKEEQEVVTKQLRKNMAYKANPVPTFYYEPPPQKPPLKKFPLTRPKSPNLNRRKSCSDTVNSSHQEVKGKHCVRHRHSVDGRKDGSNPRRTPDTKKSTRETPTKSEEVYGKNKSGNEGEAGENCN